jgi:hypothetical protein
MSGSTVSRYRIRASWRLFGALLIGLLWGGKAASLVVKYYGSSIEAATGTAGLWTAGIAVAAAITVALGMLIDWAYWSDEVPHTKPKTVAE